MIEAVYLLCVATCVAVAWLLFRGYVRSRARLLFWSGLCFVGLAINNLVLFFDVVVLPDIDLSVIRSSIALAALFALLLGLIWERT